MHLLKVYIGDSFRGLLHDGNILFMRKRKDIKKQEVLDSFDI